MCSYTYVVDYELADVVHNVNMYHTMQVYFIGSDVIELNTIKVIKVYTLNAFSYIMISSGVVMGELCVNRILTSLVDIFGEVTANQKSFVILECACSHHACILITQL